MNKKIYKLIDVILALAFILIACSTKIRHRKSTEPIHKYLETNLTLEEEKRKGIINIGEEYIRIFEHLPNPPGRNENLERREIANERMMNSLIYQVQQPCHFVMHISLSESSEVYEYRNIDTSNLLNEWGELALERMGEAYLADVVLDKYIREYGGEDVKYRIEYVGAEKDKENPKLKETLLYFMEIYGDNTKLSVMWNAYYDNAVSVLIENEDGAKTQSDDFTTIAQYALKSRKLIFYTASEESEYWMLINPNMTRDVYYFRNVEPNDMRIDNADEACDLLSYYIADQVLDKYIRDYEGSDEIYKVVLLEKEKCEDVSAYKYILQVKGTKEELQIEYTENSWFVSAKIIKGN